MDIINKHLENVSDCICVWIKELELSGFSTFFYDLEPIDSSNDDPSEEDDNAGKIFKVEDPFYEVDDNDIDKIIHEDKHDDNAGLIGQCTVVLHSGFDLW